MSDHAVEPVSRRDLVLRRYAKTGWIVIGIGVLIPVLAAAGAYRGWRLTQWGRSSAGIPLLVVGLVVLEWHPFRGLSRALVARSI